MARFMQDQILTAKCLAHYAHEAGTAAHYTYRAGRSGYHEERMVEALRGAAEALGFDLVERQTAEAPDEEEAA